MNFKELSPPGNDGAQFELRAQYCAKVHRVKVRAIRGAISLDSDTKEEVSKHTVSLLSTIFERNQVESDDLISIFFTVTTDVSSFAPAAAARTLGLDDVPLLCAQEMELDGSIPLCIRAFIHLSTSKPRDDLRHVFLRRAVILRPDLAEPGDEEE